MDAGNDVENARIELARCKAQTSHMARCLKANKLVIRRKKKEIRRIKKLNRQTVELIKRMDELVEEFLVTAEAENNNNDLETANIWSDQEVMEAVRGMNDLNLDGSNTSISAVDQVQRPCRGSVADGNSFDEVGQGSNSGRYGGGEGHE